MSNKVKTLEVVDFLPALETLPNGTRYGIFSATTPRGLRYVRYQALREWEGVKDTEPAFCRDFVKTLPRVNCRKEQRAGFEDSNPPLYTRPGTLSEAAYIDLKAAYPSIYYLTGWGVEYLRGKYLIPARDRLIWPYPQSWKIGRSYVVTGARPRQTALIVADGKLKSFAYRPARSNPSLVALVYDTLAALARFAVYSLGCIYWNVDGGILPARAVECFVSVAAEIGLECRVKYTGSAYVFNSGLWGIGNHHTARAEALNGKAHYTRQDNIALDAREAEKHLYQFGRAVK